MKQRRRCWNCGDRARPGGRLCHTCLSYQSRNDAVRPQHLIARSKIGRPLGPRSIPPTTVSIWFDSGGAVLFVGIRSGDSRKVRLPDDGVYSYRFSEWYGMATEVKVFHFEALEDALAKYDEFVMLLHPPYNLDREQHQAQINSRNYGAVIKAEEEEEEDGDEEEFYD